MRLILTIILIISFHVATGQNFIISVDGNPVAHNDTIVKTVIGNSGWYTEVTDIEIENTSSQDLIINIIQDDVNVISPANVYIGCGSFGCIPPGISNPNVDYLVNAGVKTHFTSPGFECLGSACSGSHVASYTIYDQTGSANGITVFMRYELSVPVGVQGISSDPLIIVHPNPVSDFLSVRANQQFENLEIYDVLGNLVVKKSACDPGNCVIDISSLNEGVYFLKVFFDGTNTVRRILVNR